MKTTVVLTLPEIEAGVMRIIEARPSLRGKFVATIEFFADPGNTSEELRLRANVTLFDKQETARKYHEIVTKPKAAPEKAA